MNHSKAYLRHLIRMNELSAYRLLAIHNLQYTLDLVSLAGHPIAQGRLDVFISDVRGKRQHGSS